MAKCQQVFGGQLTEQGIINAVVMKTRHGVTPEVIPIIDHGDRGIPVFQRLQGGLFMFSQYQHAGWRRAVEQVTHLFRSFNALQRRLQSGIEGSMLDASQVTR